MFHHVSNSAEMLRCWTSGNGVLCDSLSVLSGYPYDPGRENPAAFDDFDGTLPFLLDLLPVTHMQKGVTVIQYLPVNGLKMLRRDK